MQRDPAGAPYGRPLEGKIRVCEGVFAANTANMPQVSSRLSGIPGKLDFFHENRQFILKFRTINAPFSPSELIIFPQLTPDASSSSSSSSLKPHDDLEKNKVETLFILKRTKKKKKEAKQSAERKKLFA